jgi:hypothetical protein
LLQLSNASDLHKQEQKLKEDFQRHHQNLKMDQNQTTNSDQHLFRQPSFKKFNKQFIQSSPSKFSLSRSNEPFNSIKNLPPGFKSASTSGAASSWLWRNNSELAKSNFDFIIDEDSNAFGSINDQDIFSIKYSQQQYFLEQQRNLK